MKPMTIEDSDYRSPPVAAAVKPENQRAMSEHRTPKYKEVRAALMRGIVSGQHPPGSFLPSESELVRRFGVSRVTIRQALDLLRDADLVESYQGKGYCVREIKAIQDLGRLQGFGEIMAPMGVEARSEVLNAQKVPVPSEVAAALQLERGSEVIKLERLRIAADVTMSMDVSYFPLDIGEALLRLDLAHVDVFTLIEKSLGIEIGFADIVMDIVPAGKSVQKHLNTASEERLIRIERLTYDTKSRPIDFEYLYGRPETHQFKLRAARW